MLIRVRVNLQKKKYTISTISYKIYLKFIYIKIANYVPKMYICHCCNRAEVNSDVDVTKIMKEAVEIILKTLSDNNSTAAFQASSKLTRNNLDPKRQSTCHYLC